MDIVIVDVFAFFIDFVSCYLSNVDICLFIFIYLFNFAKLFANLLFEFARLVFYILTDSSNTLCSRAYIHITGSLRHTVSGSFSFYCTATLIVTSTMCGGSVAVVSFFGCEILLPQIEFLQSFCI